MAAPSKERQISVRIPSETDAWLELRAGGGQNKAGFVRHLIERERDRERERDLLAMFDEAAAHVTKEDRAERETLLGGFVDESEA